MWVWECFAQLCVLLAVGANSSTWLDTACLVTCIRNFPHQRGTIAGILKCFYGLSSAIFTLLYNAIFQNDPASFLLLVAVGPSVVSLLAVYFIRPVGPSTQKEGVKEQSSFTIMQVCTTIFIVFLFVATLYIGLGNPNPLANKILAGVLILFFTVPLCIPLVSPRHSNGHTQKNVSSIDEEDQRPLLVQLESDSSDFDSTRNSIDEIQHYTSKEVVHDNPTSSQVEDVRISDVKPFERNVTFTEALLTTDFWLLFFAFLCGMGSAITAINNLGQLGEAQGYTNASIFVSLISISNSIGRLGGGAVGDYYVRLANLTMHSSLQSSYLNLSFDLFTPHFIYTHCWELTSQLLVLWCIMKRMVDTLCVAATRLYSIFVLLSMFLWSSISIYIK